MNRDSGSARETIAGRNAAASPSEGSPAVVAARALLEAARRLRCALEADEASEIATALATRERAVERLMAQADAVARDPAAVAVMREVAAIDGETIGRASCLRREVETALAEIATARATLARLVADAAPRLVERTA